VQVVAVTGAVAVWVIISDLTFRLRGTIWPVRPLPMPRTTNP
jgi:hypothetical protein